MIKNSLLQKAYDAIKKRSIVTHDEKFLKNFVEAIKISEEWIDYNKEKPEIGREIIIKGDFRVYCGAHPYVNEVIGITTLREDGTLDDKFISHYHSDYDKITHFRYLNFFKKEDYE